MLQQILRIPQAAPCNRCDQVESLFVGRDVLFRADEFQSLYHILIGESAEVKSLAPADDRGRHSVDVRSRQDHDDLRWRLFQRLEQRVEGRVREHVHFVDDVDLEAAQGRP